MRRLLITTLTLTTLFVILLVTAHTVGSRIGVPFNFADRLSLPLKPPFDALLPLKLGAFTRQQVVEPFHSVGNSHLLARATAIYQRPGDPHPINLELKLYNSPQVAALLINPEEWRLHSKTQDKYFVRGDPISFVFTATSNGYHAYQLEYVSGDWNISMQSVNSLDGLLSFANLYPY